MLLRRAIEVYGVNYVFYDTGPCILEELIRQTSHEEIPGSIFFGRTRDRKGIDDIPFWLETKTVLQVNALGPP